MQLKRGDSHPKVVAALKDFRGYTGNLGMWTGVTPAGAPLIVRNVNSQKIYALEVNFP